MIYEEIKNIEVKDLPEFHEDDHQFSLLHLFLKEGIDHKDRKLTDLPFP